VSLRPTGYPPISDIKTAVDASPGSLKTYLVTGENTAENASPALLFWIKQESTINGKSDGISTPPTVVSPLLIPPEITDGFLRIKKARAAVAAAPKNSPESLIAFSFINHTSRIDMKKRS
jgi:hypothetical protein